MPGHEQLVERLHHALVDEIRARRPEYLSGPFTVAEIYQELVPYRTHRDLIGAAMNGDYEHALLGLLSGWGGYVTLASEPARRRLAEELESANPNTGIFREYAALDVKLNPARIPEPGVRRADASAPAIMTEAAPESLEASPPAGASVLAEPFSLSFLAAADDTPHPAPPPTRPHGDALADAEGGGGGKTTAAGRAAAPTATEAGESCRWCRESLPGRASLRYCPFCGMDVKLVPCPSCGEELEPSWRFCIACGAHVATEE